MKMNNEMSKKHEKAAGVMANVAMKFGKIAANSACCYIYHQPKMPEGMKKLRKF